MGWGVDSSPGAAVPGPVVTGSRRRRYARHRGASGQRNDGAERGADPVDGRDEDVGEAEPVEQVVGGENERPALHLSHQYPRPGGIIALLNALGFERGVSDNIYRKQL